MKSRLFRGNMGLSGNVALGNIRQTMTTDEIIFLSSIFTITTSSTYCLLNELKHLQSLHCSIN